MKYRNLMGVGESTNMREGVLKIGGWRTVFVLAVGVETGRGVSCRSTRFALGAGLESCSIRIQLCRADKNKREVVFRSGVHGCGEGQPVLL